MIVVIDTNVWISALQFALRRGSPRLALERAVQHHTIAICAGIEFEIDSKLTENFGWTRDEVKFALDSISPFRLRVETHGNIHVCRDPDDNMVLECAVNARADLIVTGDKDLLVLGSYEEIRIVTCAEYLAMSA